MSIKNLKYLVLSAAMLTCATSCEKDLQPYSHPDCYLNFVFSTSSNDDEATIEDITQGDTNPDLPVIYNFKFSGDVAQDTVWAKAKVLGYVVDYDRAFALEQVLAEGAENAVPGVDYIPFDDPEMQKRMVVKAGENYVNIPVVVKRTEKLKTQSLTLKVRIKENGNFKNGYDCMQTRVFEFTDRLSKPSVWDEFNLDYYLGYYGEVKHKLMIEWSGMPWDDEYITDVYNTDNAYIDYMDQVFQKRLAEENAKRTAQGLDVYREADGTEVDFTPASWW